MEKSASFPAYSVGTTLSAQCYLGIEPLLQRAASTGDAELLLTLLKVQQCKLTFLGAILRSRKRDHFFLVFCRSCLFSRSRELEIATILHLPDKRS